MLQTAHYQCLQKTLLNLHEGLLTALSLLWSFTIPATGTARFSPSETHEIKGISSLRLPSIGVRISTACLGNQRMYKLIPYTGLFEMIVSVLTTCHTQYTSDSSICVFLFNRTTLQVFVTYLTGALYVHPL